MSQEKQITLTYLNVRQSISILIAKLILIDILLAGLIVGTYFVLVQGDQLISGLSQNVFIFLPAFFGIGIFKILVSCYIILLWLNEYYEITPEYIIHKKGIIFRKQEQYRLDHVRGIDVEDSFLGEMLNFASITLYDIRLNKYLDMNYVHNARRYAKVFKQLRPHLEMREDHVWIPLKEKEEISPIDAK